MTWLIEMGIMAEPADLDRLGMTVDGAGGVTFVPALAGLAAPYWKPQARAAFTGMTMGTERGHLVRAAIEGIAAQVALLARAAGRDLGSPLTRLRVDGGLTRSRVLLQTQADLLQAPVEVYPSPHATALGVAEFADLGAKQGSRAHLGEATWHPDAVVEPRIGPDEAAERLTAWQTRGRGDDGSMSASGATYDVVVVGGGVVGCAVARLLSHHDITVALVEAGPDLGAGTSKANTAILHTGFDATPGSVESRLVASGYALLRAYAPTVGISIEETGALLVAWDDEQAASLPHLAAKAVANGYDHAQVIDAAAVYDSEPHLGAGATGGMLVPGEHIIDPWSTPLAFAYEAVANGAAILLSHDVNDCQVGHEVERADDCRRRPVTRSVRRQRRRASR